MFWTLTDKVIVKPLDLLKDHRWYYYKKNEKHFSTSVNKIPNVNRKHSALKLKVSTARFGNPEEMV